MPIGKDSIRKRVIGSDCAACGECTDKAPLAEKTTVSERAPLAGKAPAQKPASAPAVTESVLTNVSPEVVEKVTGHAEGATSDHVQITDRMPDYLL